MLSGQSEFSEENEEASLFNLPPEEQKPKEVSYNPNMPIETFNFIVTGWPVYCKIMVIGDDKQLPPASHDFIGYSLFTSILQQYETTLLKTEYILDLINPNYQYQLNADDSVKNILLLLYITFPLLTRRCKHLMSLH